MTKSAWHSIILLVSLFAVYFFANDSILANYILQLAAVLIIILIVARHLHRPSSFHLAETVVSTIAVVLVTMATGGTASPFFFLNHFLLFEISFLLEPSVSISLSLGLMVFYLFSKQVNPTPASLIALLSFVFMTPLAFLSGILYQRFKKRLKKTSPFPL